MWWFIPVTRIGENWIGIAEVEAIDKRRYPVDSLRFASRKGMVVIAATFCSAETRDFGRSGVNAGAVPVRWKIKGQKSVDHDCIPTTFNL